MRRVVSLLAGLGVLWSGVSAAAPLRPLELPPPDLVPLLPLVAPPLDKPPVSVPEIPLPDPLETVPPLPSPPLLVDLSQKPLPPLPPPRILACNPLGTLFGVASELLECGRARFQRGELEEARTALVAAARGSTDRELIREARYWLGETLFRLNRLEEAERTFRLVYQDAPSSEFGLHALHALGWLALQLNDPARALESFERVIKAGLAPEVIPYASHGRALALYAQGRYAEAREAWQALSGRSVPAPLVREITFWLGETLGRVGEYTAAEEHLRRFTNAGPHRLLEAGILRLGWWALAAGHQRESAKAFRSLLSEYPGGVERPWARVGLIRALLALDDFPEGLEEARRFQATDPTHPLVVPSLLLLLRSSVEKDQRAIAQALAQEMLALNLAPASRSFVLLLTGELSRREGRGGEARSQFELARSIQPDSALAWRATLGLAQVDLETREFGRAVEETGALLSRPLPLELRSALLLLRGEAAYRAKAYESAAEAFGRFLVEFPGHPEVSSAAFSLGWAEFRLGRRDAARQHWLDFARSFPRDSQAGEALLLSAELAAQAGDAGTARDILDQFLARFPNHPHAALAKLNRAILELRAGRPREALVWLRELKASAPLSPFIGRMRLAAGVARLPTGNPAEATAEFGEALRQGEDVLAHVGLGSSALAQRQWPEAVRHFADARASGPESVRLLAEYGMAAVAFHEGKREEFARAATTLVQSPLLPRLVARLIYVMAGIAVEEKRWAEARQWTLKLQSDFPGNETTPDALACLGAGAFAAKEWPLVRESYQLLLTRYPQNPQAKEARLDLAEAFLRTGAPAEARSLLEPVVGSPTSDPGQPRALLLLAEIQEAMGDRAKAMDTLARLLSEHPSSEFAWAAQTAQGRLLLELGRWEEARHVWETVLNGTDAAAQVEAAFRLGEAYRARGLYEEAVEADLTAAYLGPETPWGRRALLGAGESFMALNDSRSAAIVYRKLLAQAGIEPELAAEARKRLGQTP